MTGYYVMKNIWIIANWKSNPVTFTEALKLAKASDFKNVIITPPYLYLEKVGKLIKKASLGAQNVFQEDGGPYTGEVSVSQLKNLRVRYVIIGHSERRKHLGETDEMINKKVKLALGGGLKVILCVGEDWPTRRKGIVAAKKFVANQLKKDLAGVKKQERGSKNLLIAYEPIWSISTSTGKRVDTPRDAREMIWYIRKILDSNFQILPSVLYGGSVTPRNAKSFLSQSEVDGALVGGASLSPQSFRTIIKIRNSFEV